MSLRAFPRRHDTRWPVALTLACLTPACSPPAAEGPAPPDLLTAATAAGFESPDSVPSGWHRLRFLQRPDGRGRNLVLFAIPDSLDVEAFAAALDTARTTPAPATALGGSESPTAPDDTTSLVLHLEPGRYLLASMGRGEDGRRHVTNGARRELHVTADSTGARAPRPSASLTLIDFAFVGADTMDRGAHRIRVANEGKQDHLLLLHRLGEGVTLADWLTEEGAPSTRVGGVSRIGPGREVYLDVSLTIGRYAAICLIPDPASGRMHAEMGMVREVVVK